MFSYSLSFLFSSLLKIIYPESPILHVKINYAVLSNYTNTQVHDPISVFYLTASINNSFIENSYFSFLPLVFNESIIEHNRLL